MTRGNPVQGPMKVSSRDAVGVRRAAFAVTIALLAATALSCLPGRFDDLENEAWVQLAERDDSQASGDWAIAVQAMPPASGKLGMRFVLSLGKSPPGLAVVTFDEHGSKTAQTGTNLGGSLAAPLHSTDNVDALAKLDAEQGTEGVVVINEQDLCWLHCPAFDRDSRQAYSGERRQ